MLNNNSTLDDINVDSANLPYQYLIEKEIENALKKQVELKIQCRNALFEYKDFLKEQEELRNKRLEETNPQHAM